MIYQYSKTSIKRLQTCHPDLQKVFYEVLNGFDHTILCGHRSEAEQNKAFNEGKSKLRYPQSKHNSTPSLAVDVAPYPVDWNDIRRFYLFAGYVIATAKSLGVELRWGGDWDCDTEIKDNHFNDLVHFELKQ